MMMSRQTMMMCWEAHELKPAPNLLHEARLYAAKLLQFVQDQPHYPAKMQLWLTKIQQEIAKTTVANLNRKRQTTIDQYFVASTDYYFDNT